MKLLLALLALFALVSIVYSDCTGDAFFKCFQGCDIDMAGDRDCDMAKCTTYCNYHLKCDGDLEKQCENTKPVGCDVDCSPAGFIAPTFLSIVSIFFFVYRALFH